MAAGLDPAAFWAVTPREAMVILDGADARAARELKIQQQLAYSTAVLIGTAVNAPKSFPRFHRVFPDPKAKATTPEAMLAAMRSWVRGVNHQHKVKE